MDDNLVKTCSPEVRKGLNFLDDVTEKKERYISKNASAFYVLNKVDSPKIKNYIHLSKNPDFWDRDWQDNPLDVWFLIKLGMKNNEITEELSREMKRLQTVDGKYQLSIPFEHSGYLRLFSLVRPESKSVKNGIDFLIRNQENLDDLYLDDVRTIAIGILALFEIDYYKYEQDIKVLARILKSKQENKDNFSSHAKILSTSVAIIALVRVYGTKDDSVSRAIKWLKENQSGDGSWPSGMVDTSLVNTSYALLALFSAGDGPKISHDLWEWSRMLATQKMNYMRPFFLHTSPIWESKVHIKEIHDKIKTMIPSAKKEIRIASLYIDLLYEEIINFCRDNPQIEVKIICRPFKDVQGSRERIGKNAIDLLNRATKGKTRKNQLLHSRVIIIDDNQMLVSSADLTRDQLFDEFNAGIYTKDKESIQKAILFFENMWKNSEKIKH